MQRLFVLAFFIVLGLGAQAQTVLTVLDTQKSPDPIEYTLADLDALTQTEVVTTNEFVDGTKAFTGPLVREILDLKPADTAKTLRLIAINEYEVTVPASDTFDYDVILATRMDNEVLPRRTKGPIWLIYPVSDHTELQDARVNSKLIWQVERIEVQ